MDSVMTKSTENNKRIFPRFYRFRVRQAFLFSRCKKAALFIYLFMEIPVGFGGLLRFRSLILGLISILNVKGWDIDSGMILKVSPFISFCLQLQLDLVLFICKGPYESSVKYFRSKVIEFIELNSWERDFSKIGPTLKSACHKPAATKCMKYFF